MKYMLLPIDGDVRTSSAAGGDGAGTNVLTVQAAHDPELRQIR
jgi:hypothetical protein